MPNRSIRDERQAADEAPPKRNKVSPPTQSAFGPASASDPAPPSDATAAAPDPATKDLSVGGTIGKIKQYEYAQDKAIDDQS